MSVIRCRAHARQVTRTFALTICAAFCAYSPLHAGETGDAKTPPVTTAEETDYKNWIEFGIGGLIIHDDEAQFKQQHGMSGDIFGGISDLHFEHAVGEKGLFTLDGHAIFDNDDYEIIAALTLPKIGYIRAGYTEFRTWYDGNSGFFPVSGASFFDPPIPEMHIDRGEAFVELGVRLPDWPEITVRYSHQFRDGQKDSTIWGDTTLTGLPLPSPTPPASNAQRNPARKIAPAFRDIDETRDIFSLEATKAFGNTEVGLGMRYEHTETDNSLNLWRGAGQFAILSGVAPNVAITGPNGTPAAERFITQKERTESDLFSGHGTVETHINDQFWVTAAYSYTSLNSDLTGSRIIGADYDSTYTDPILNLQSNDHGQLNLSGASQATDQVFNLNFLWMPGESSVKSAPASTPDAKDSKSSPSVEPSVAAKNLTVLLGFRYTHQDLESDSVFLDTNTTANVAPFTATNPRGGFSRAFPPTLRLANSSADFDNFAERLEVRYTGLANWLFYAEGEWEEEDGSVFENEIVGGSNQGALNKDTSLLAQKYTAGVNWYPINGLSVSSQYYHKSVSYDNDFNSELAVAPVPGAERNQRLIAQDWTTDDFNIRVTWRPTIPAKLGTLSIVSRYDYVSTLIQGQWAVSPTQTGGTIPNPPTPAQNTFYQSEHTASILSHIISESITWNPLPRLYFQGQGSYVINQTNTPVDGVVLNGVTANAAYTTPTFEAFNNNYWTVSAACGYVLDDKTDLRLDYSYYRAGNYFKNPQVALPYGTTDSQNTVSATATRQLSKNMHLLFKYTYFDYNNQTSGGNNSYTAHAFYSGLQFRF